MDNLAVAKSRINHLVNFYKSQGSQEIYSMASFSLYMHFPMSENTFKAPVVLNFSSHNPFGRFEVTAD